MMAMRKRIESTQKVLYLHMYYDNAYNIYFVYN